MKRRAYIILILLAVIAAFIVRETRIHNRKLALGAAYTGGQNVTVWTSPAPVRSPVTTLTYGTPVQVTDRYGDFAEVHTDAGIQGWVLSKTLLAPEVWHEASLLDQYAKRMAIQARGFTRVRTNFHTAAGRDTPVLLDAPSGVPVLMLERKTEPAPAQKSKGSDGDSEKMEDWWLVRADTKADGEIAGWILGKFVSLALPEALSGYASSEGYNVMAWYEINQGVDSAGAAKPEYLVVGTRGGEGQPCDFTLIRVYTWSKAHNRYETAFIDNSVCGRLPVDVTPATAPGGAGYFRFRNEGPSGPENREYGMKFTMVRRMGGKPSPRKGKRR